MDNVINLKQHLLNEANDEIQIVANEIVKILLSKDLSMNMRQRLLVILLTTVNSYEYNELSVIDLLQDLYSHRRKELELWLKDQENANVD